MTAVAAEWAKAFGRPSIPFAKTDRRRLLEAETIHDYVEAYRRMWIFDSWAKSSPSG
jgi:hypothetical protein